MPRAIAWQRPSGARFVRPYMSLCVYVCMCACVCICKWGNTILRRVGALDTLAKGWSGVTILRRVFAFLHRGDRGVLYNT